MADTLKSGFLGSAARYVDAARTLAPFVQELRQEIEQQRTIPTELAGPMTEAGFFSLWRCHALGGPELTFMEFAQVIEELSRADGSELIRARSTSSGQCGSWCAARKI